MVDDRSRLRDLEVDFSGLSVEVKAIREEVDDQHDVLRGDGSKERPGLTGRMDRMEDLIERHEKRDQSNLRALWAAIALSLGINAPKAWGILRGFGMVP